ncbi:hypothetical protein BH11PSE8_BH11PSE8_17700 [soil metagenome]
MFTDQLIASPPLMMGLLVLVIAYWRAMGGVLDSRVFIALNFGLITLWVFLSEHLPALRLMAVVFMALLIAFYRTSHNRRISRRVDTALDLDLSWLLIILSLLALAINLQAGTASLVDARALVLEQREQSALAKYSTYLLLSASWIGVHLVCHAAAQRRWSRLQLLALALSILASVTSLSKASFLPILLTLLFVYSKRLGMFKIGLYAAAGFALTIFFVQRLFEDLSVTQVTEIVLSRIIQNMDVLDYMETLGDTSLEYPHASIFYLFWPFFQFTQQDFVAFGVWIHGTMRNDWRGFGPNPTFLADMLLASQYVGIVLAPVFGWLLKVSDRSRFRVFVTMACYTFLQDWYFGCISAAGFFILFSITKLLQTKRKRGPYSSRAPNTNDIRHPDPPLSAP